MRFDRMHRRLDDAGRHCEGKPVLLSGVPSEGDQQGTRLNGVPTGLGMTVDTELTILSDGADGPGAVESPGKTQSLLGRTPIHLRSFWDHLDGGTWFQSAVRQNLSVDPAIAMLPITADGERQIDIPRSVLKIDARGRTTPRAPDNTQTDVATTQVPTDPIQLRPRFSPVVMLSSLMRL
jgi:hypothetical protein